LKGLVVGPSPCNRQARDDAPKNSLPSWEECSLRVANSKYVEQRVGGGYYDENVKYANQLHKVIYEYDDADPYRSAWFLHRLELLINEITSANTAPQPVVDVNAQDAERYRFIRARIGYDNNGLYLPCGNNKPDPSLTDSAIDKALLSAGKEPV
jgi:hypothetical protein